MIRVILAVHILLAIAMIGAILVQRSEGGALGIGGGGGGLMTTRGQANLLTRVTAVLAALFFATSMALVIMAGTGNRPTSIMDRPPISTQPAPPAAPSVPAVPSVPSVPLQR